MDKYEYKISADEIRNLIQQKKYKEAVEIADTIDWKNVKNSMMLCTISDLYKMCKRYEDSRDVLMIAYQRNPQGRLILYSLCELSLKLKEIDNAIEYYREYVQVAPKDSGRYILKYKLFTVQNVKMEDRITVLEELKSIECKEKWMYELAYLYHMMGYGEKCVEECDQIVLYFGEGKYVVKALELKMSHHPLSGEQDLLYRRLTAPSDEEVLVKDIDVSKYNTIDLQKELANSMKEVLFDDSEARKALKEDLSQTTVFTAVGTEKAEPVENMDETRVIETEEVRKAVEPEVKVEAKPEPVIQKVPEPVVIRKPAEPAPVLEKEPAPVPVPTPAIERVVQPSRDIYGIHEVKLDDPNSPAIRFPAYDDMVSVQGDGQIAFVMPEEEMVEKQITGQISISDVLAEWERMKNESEKRWEADVRRRVFEQTDGIFKEFDASSKNGLLESLEVSVSETPLEEAIEEVTPEEVPSMAITIEPGVSVKDPEPEPEPEIETKSRDIREIVIEPEVEPEPAETEEVSVEEAPEAEPLPEELSFDRTPFITESVSEPEPEAETSKEEEPEEKNEEPEIEESSAAVDDYLMRFAEAGEERDIADRTKEEEPAEETEEEPEETESEYESEDNLEEETQESKPVINVFSNEYRTDLTDDQYDKFEAFVQTQESHDQIVTALKGISMKASEGNVIISSDDIDSAVELGRTFIMELSDEGQVSGKVAKIKASTLNAKDAIATLGTVLNGALIIQDAHELRRETLDSIRRVLSKEDNRLFLIFTIAKRLKQKFTIDNSDMLASFTINVDIEPLDDEELVAYAIKYAYSREYAIDEMGNLALHQRIDERQTNSHSVLVSEVKDIVDEAIAHATRKTPSHFFKVLTGKRYDDNDMVVLTEKDFQVKNNKE